MKKILLLILLPIAAWASHLPLEEPLPPEVFQAIVIEELAAQRRMLEAQDRALRDLVMDMRMRRWKKDDFEHSKPVVWPESYTRRP